VGTEHRKPRGGQAMIELTIGMVSLIVLTAIIVQLAFFVRAGHETAVRAREQAGSLALQDVPVSAAARYIGATGPGEDGSPYTRDDEYSAADPSSLYSDILDPLAADPSDWNTLDEIPGNDLTRLHRRESPIGVFGLLRGEDSATVPLLPAVSSLLYRADSILIEETVWMPWTKGVY
jgi:hypothetical protein